MKITKIVVKGLFGIFDHEIPLNTEGHITIIHGPNGYGKTILLTLLNEILNSKFDSVYSVPFNQFSIHFSNDSTLTLSKHEITDSEGKKNEPSSSQLKFEFEKPDSKNRKPIEIKPTAPEVLEFALKTLEHRIANLELIDIDSQRWFYHSTSEELSLDEVLNRFRDKLPDALLTELIKISKPAWVNSAEDSIQIHFIETQRLLDISSTRLRFTDSKKVSELVPAVNTYSTELSKLIQQNLAEYGSLSQSLDRTFPSRLVKSNGSNGLTLKKLKNELNKLEEKRKQLIAAGFLEAQKGT